MTLAVTKASPSGNPVVGIDACRFETTDVDAVNEETNAEIRHYLSIEFPGEEAARSPIFSGNGFWDNYVFPVAGAAMVRLRRVSDDGIAASLAVTVDAS